MISVGILLAAGQSRRFGVENKLVSTLGGRALASYSADAIKGARFDKIVAVFSDDAVQRLLEGFDEIRRIKPGSPMSDSLKAGIAMADALGARKATIVLADMPFVTSAIIREVSFACREDTPSAAIAESNLSPPVAFPASWFPRIDTLDGDAGAKKLLKGAAQISTIAVEATALIDVDTPEKLAECEARISL